MQQKVRIENCKKGANLHDLDSVQWYHYSKCPKNICNKINRIPQLFVITSHVANHQSPRGAYFLSSVRMEPGPEINADWNSEDFVIFC